MGVCSGKKKNKDEVIQEQINQVIKEQEKQQEEIIAPQQQDVRSQSQSQSQLQSQSQSQLQLVPVQPEDMDEIIEADKQDVPEEPKVEKSPKGKQGKKHHHHHHHQQNNEITPSPTRSQCESNYVKKHEYSVQVEAIILVDCTNEKSPHYMMTFRTEFQDYQYEVQMKGINVMIVQPKRHLEINPLDYVEAARESRFWTFFNSDTYFNADPEKSNDCDFFSQLLKVERKVFTERSLQSSPTKKLSKRGSTMDDGVTPGKKPGKQKQRTVNELMEIVTIFDLEAQARFKGILFHLIMQQHHKQLEDVFLFIRDSYFLFDQIPSLDKPTFYRVCLLYQNLDYTLKDLQNHCIETKMNLSPLLNMRLASGLIKILFKCYAAHIYKLNITLTSVYYIKEDKQFKLQGFNRIHTLVAFDEDELKQNLESLSDKKLALYKKSFLKDYEAVSDIICMFRQPQTANLKQIKQMRKKVREEYQDPNTGMDKYNETIDYSKYMAYIDENFDAETDKSIAEFLRSGLVHSEDLQMDQKMEEILNLMSTIDGQIIGEEGRIEQERIRQLEAEEAAEDIEDDDEEEQEIIQKIKYIDTFDIELSPEIAKPVEMFRSPMKEYKQMVFASLFMNSKFLESCQEYLHLNEDTKSFHRIHGILLSSYAQIQNSPDDQQRNERQLQVLDEAVNIIKQHPSDSADPLHFYVLISLLSIIPSRPMALLLQLQRSIQRQYEYKQRIINRLRGNNLPNGLIEMRKMIFVQVLFAEHYMATHHYQQAQHQMQKVITLQLKMNLKQNLLYGYTLFINGVICEQTLQTSSSMLNLEMAKTVYDTFFPHPQLIENIATSNLSTIELNLGRVYFNLHDQDNALKCLKKAQKLRQSRFDEFSNEVLEIHIQILRIYVEQEETGAAVELCYQYAKRIDAVTKQGKTIRTTLFGQFQFIMAAIFDCTGALLSAIRFFQRADRAFTAARNNTYLKQLHISGKIKELLGRVKERALLTLNLGGEPKAFSTRGFQSMSEAIKPYFMGHYGKGVISLQETIHNPRISGLFVVAHGFLNNKDAQLAYSTYSKAAHILKKEKKDETYGIVLMKLGMIQMNQNNLEEGIKNLKFALELHDRHLSFPLKQLLQLKCSIYIILAEGSKGKTKFLVDYFEMTERIIDAFRAILNWNNVAEKVIFNKFVPIIARGGIKIAHQLVEIETIIQGYFHMKKALVHNLDKPDRLIEHVNKQKAKWLGQHKVEGDWQMKRASCVMGMTARVSITRVQLRPTNPAIAGMDLKVLDAVPIPQDQAEQPTSKRRRKGEKPDANTITQVLKKATGKQIKEEMFVVEPPKIVVLDLQRINQMKGELDQKRKEEEAKKPQQTIKIPPRQPQVQLDVPAQQHTSKTQIILDSALNQSVHSKMSDVKQSTKINPFEKVSRKTIKK